MTTKPPIVPRTKLETFAGFMGAEMAKLEGGVMALLTALETRVSTLESRIADLEKP